MPHLNYHHLRYFWTIAREGSVSRAARHLNVSPSALSVQLKALEAQLGQQLFERRGKTLHLTEAGRIALEYANGVFQSGHELLETLTGLASGRQVLRVGAVATLSRNFQIGLLRPLLKRQNVEIVIHSGVFADLLNALDGHKLDLVLANQPAPTNADSAFFNTLLAEQPVSLVGRKTGKRSRLCFPDDVRSAPLVLPGRGSSVRSAFDALLARAGIHPIILAEVDDMAMLRLVGRESPGLTLVPPVVVVDELKSGVLIERCRVPGLHEQFFAISRERKFASPLATELLERAQKSGQRGGF
jgi:LysR family transcriptional activator of nhaA